MPSTFSVKMFDEPVVPSAHSTTQDVPRTIWALSGWVMKTLKAVPGCGAGGGGVLPPFETKKGRVAVAVRLLDLLDGFRLDTVNLCLWRAEERVPLTPKAFDVLRYLVERADRLVTQDEVLEALWPETFVNPEGGFFFDSPDSYDHLRHILLGASLPSGSTQSGPGCRASPVRASMRCES